MDDPIEKLLWEQGAESDFKALINKTPVFLRGVAEEKVLKTINAIVRSEGASSVSEKILIDAFLSETPFGFHGLLKKDMKELNIDYAKYGHAE